MMGSLAEQELNCELPDCKEGESPQLSCQSPYLLARPLCSLAYVPAESRRGWTDPCTPVHSGQSIPARARSAGERSAERAKETPRGLRRCAQRLRSTGLLGRRREAGQRHLALDVTVSAMAQSRALARASMVGGYRGSGGVVATRGVGGPEARLPVL
jgi:hypothetical protein